MADAYPWGAQAPQARLSKLQRDLTKNSEARDTYMEGHRKKLASFDETDRTLRSDIRACEGIIEKERNEANSQALAKILARVANSRSVDLDALLKNPAVLEERLASLGTELAAASEGKGKKGASGKSAAPAEA